ncbi:MAG TPA: nuclear transport factor 2 family protein [Candidatus Limnocylindria bacterium]|nr:nuclear transport factor 2 family protein [Candidatus Limnocylindria bacterium]
MNWITCLSLLAALVIGCAGARLPAPTYPPAPTAVATGLAHYADVQKIRSRYEHMASAFAARDVEAIAALRTADFQVDFPNGDRHDAAQMLEVLRHFFVQNRPPIQLWYTLRSAERTGPDTIVVEVFQQGSRYQELAGKLRKVEHDITQRETWRREDGVWRFRAVAAIRNPHRWVDGKPIDPSKPFDPAAPPFRPPKP